MDHLETRPQGSLASSGPNLTIRSHSHSQSGTSTPSRHSDEFMIPTTKDSDKDPRNRSLRWTGDAMSRLLHPSADKDPEKQKGSRAAVSCTHEHASRDASYWRCRLRTTQYRLLPTRAMRRLALAAAVILVLLVILLPTLLILRPRHSAANAAPTFDGQNGSGSNGNPLIVDVGYGQYQGVPLTNGVSQWLGMRYAGPPTGQNRFAAPIPPVPFSGVQMANQLVRGCQGLGPRTAGTSEDCMSIDVYAPSNASAASKLPVYVFIQGGGNQGASSHLNGSQLIQASGYDMIFASFTYRVGAYGFLASSEIQAGASLNNGYKDQRQALQWVKDNIASFGGDSDSITMGGQSAGAGAAVSQLAAYGKTDNGGLFHAALIQSPSMPPMRTVAEQQFQYDNLTAKLNCSTAADSLACLRAVPHETFLANVGVLPYPGGTGQAPVFSWNPVIDDDFIPEIPLSAIAGGRYAMVPTIIGDVHDEGTIFTPQSITDANGTWTFLQSSFPTLNDTAQTQFSTMYNFSDETAPYWHRASDAYGELRYTCPGTQIADLMLNQSHTAVWRYNFDVQDPKFVAKGTGAFHGSEMPAIFGLASFRGMTPPSYTAGQANANIVAVMQGYWSSFVKHGDPSISRAAGTPVWTRWDGAQRMHLVEQPAMEHMPADQTARCDYLASIALDLDQ